MIARSFAASARGGTPSTEAAPQTFLRLSTALRDGKLPADVSGDVIISGYKITIVSFLSSAALRDARRAAGLSQEELADRAGLSRMTVQKLEAGSIDPRVSTLMVLARALGLELALVPAELKPAVEDFLRSGGRVVAQPAGIGAPPSIVDVIARDRRRT